MPWHAHSFLPQVAEIHRASKDGQLYTAGGAQSCSVRAEPLEPSEHDILPASQVYSVSSVLPPPGITVLAPGRAHELLCPVHSTPPAPRLFSHQPDPQGVLGLSFCYPLLRSPPTRPSLDQPGVPSRGPSGQNPLSSCSQLKPKRVGAGFRKGSCPFQTATELMEKTQAEAQAPWPVQEPPSQPCGLQNEESSEAVPRLRGEAPGSSAHYGGLSPEKAKGPSRGSSLAQARPSRKRQLLATAALRDSQNIARFFCQRAESPTPLASALGAEGASPSCDGVQGPLAVVPVQCTGEEDGAPGCLAALPQTEGYTRKGPR